MCAYVYAYVCMCMRVHLCICVRVYAYARAYVRAMRVYALRLLACARSRVYSENNDFRKCYPLINRNSSNACRASSLVAISKR